MRRLTGWLVPVLLLFGAGTLPAAAQERTGLTLSPPVGELTISPGGTAAGSVTLTNATTSSLSVLAAVGDVAPSGNEFALREPGSMADSAAAWVTVTPSSVEIGPGGTAVVTVSVRAPAGVPAGEHAAGILFSAGGGVQAFHTVIVEVLGPGLTRAARVTSIKMPAFETDGRIVFRLSVRNTGNTHAVIGGTVTVRDRLRRTDTNFEIPTLYAMPGRTSEFLIAWNDPPPLLVARVTARVGIRYESPSGPSDVQTVATSGIAIIYWAFAVLVALVLLVLRLLLGLVLRRRRKRARRERAAGRDSASRTGAAPVELPAPQQPATAPAGRTVRSAWETEPEHSSAAGAIAVRRAKSALTLLRQGAGKSGVRTDVAVGVLRGVGDLPEVRREVEHAYDDAVGRSAVREAAALALALSAVESPRAPEALLRGYAKADRVLASRLKRALAACDPADLRAHHELLDALPHARRDSLPVG